MMRISLLLLFIPASLLALAEDEKQPEAIAADQAAQSAQAAGGDSPRGELGWCGESHLAAGICIACSQLPAVLAPPPGECCSDPDVLEICSDCIRDPSGCLLDALDIVQDGGAGEEMTYPTYDKRYGMLWLWSKPVFVPSTPSYADHKKRFGALYSGEENKESEGKEVEKRWGTLNLGSYFAKRFGMLGMGSRYLGHMAKGYGNVNIGKRFGTLNLGGRRFGPYLNRFGTLNMGKKWGTLNLGKRWGSLNVDNKLGSLTTGKKNYEETKREPAKRYGTLNLGKRFGRRNQGGSYAPTALGKRYGTLNLGGSYGYYPFKRSEYVPYNGDIAIDMKKRYGRLFMGG